MNEGDSPQRIKQVGVRPLEPELTHAMLSSEDRVCPCPASQGRPYEIVMSEKRRWMVEYQIAARGVVDEAVLSAMDTVPREEFVPPEAVPFAYDDRPLLIGEGQTISQPYIVAAMAEAAEISPGDRVLEVGTGSGYGAAILGQIAAQVVTIERHLGLAHLAKARCRALGYDNIEVVVGDGTLGWPVYAPYDAIVVTAGGPAEPPPDLIDQLAPSGRLVIPLGAGLRGQELVQFRRSSDGRTVHRRDLGPVHFVPLIGAAGWSSEGYPDTRLLVATRT